MDDLNKFESLGTKDEGCSVGNHRYGESDAQIEADGEMTVLVLTCVSCGLQTRNYAQLGINDLMATKAPDTDRRHVQVEEIAAPIVVQPRQPESSGGPTQEEVLEKLFGR